MSLKKLGVILLVVTALGAVMASSASASNAFVTKQGYWYVAGTKLASGVANAVGLNVKPVGTQKLKTKVAGSPLDITVTGVSCVGCVIDNTTAAESGNAFDTATIMGRLKFTGLSVTEPPSCGVTEPIETKEITAELGMNSAGTLATFEFFPTAGKTTAFATIEITGATCAIAGLYKVTGTVYGEALNATNVSGKVAKVKTSAAIQEAAGEATSLKFGENGAFLTGELEGELASGKEWKGNES